MRLSGLRFLKIKKRSHRAAAQYVSDFLISVLNLINKTKVFALENQQPIWNRTFSTPRELETMIIGRKQHTIPNARLPWGFSFGIFFFNQYLVCFPWHTSPPLPLEVNDVSATHHHVILPFVSVSNIPPMRSQSPPPILPPDDFSILLAPSLCGFQLWTNKSQPNTRCRQRPRLA